MWLKSPSLPEYFQNTFHYQTDGWMSAASARVYETSTETLFVGRQDAMQRTTLVHVHDFMAGEPRRRRRAGGSLLAAGCWPRPCREFQQHMFASLSSLFPTKPSLATPDSFLSPATPLPANTNQTADKVPSEVQALEVAAGTGRFATYVKDNYPAMPLTVSDLSPFYLSAARDNLRYWKRMRAPDADLGGVDGTGATFLQAAAESLGTGDESFDLVYCVYLFHELPADVRAAAAKEMARCVVPQCPVPWRCRRP